MNPISQDKTPPYNLHAWGEGYVSITEQGELAVCPEQDATQAISLKHLLHKIRALGLRTPVLVRFKSILHHRVNTLCGAFNTLSEQLGYQGDYKIVYPIKVNQQRRVVEEIVSAEPACSHGQIGLEAGSKPELLAVLAMDLAPNSVIVCNGYKDRHYIRMALLGQKLGYKVFIVAEKLSELSVILEEAASLGVQASIGLRAKLSTIGKGNWQNTGGEKSKFGLSSHQIIEAVALLKQHQQLASFELLHFHLGSQIANIRDIHNGFQECAKIYSQLRALGVPIHTVDIGGGLGVDYDGTRSRSACSMNYNMEDYARNVIQAFQEESDRYQLPHPHIISESGRAITAHHAILISDVVEKEAPKEFVASFQSEAINANSPAALVHLWDDYQALKRGQSTRSLLEIYHDAAHAIEDVHKLFVLGTLTLQQKAQAEHLYLCTCHQLRQQLKPVNHDHQGIIDELDLKLAEKLFVNFSIFQSLPDVWGIDQIFPILPLEGLHKPLSRNAVVQDITCDSDGRIDKYVAQHGVESTLSLPEKSLTTGLDSVSETLCFFMLGAYQEILGDKHNLFGDTDSVDVSIDAQGEIILAHAMRGDTIADVLQDVNFTAEYLMKNYQQLLDKKGLSADERERYLIAFEDGLESYTYLG
jgi:arginine decarboxylase